MVEWLRQIPAGVWTAVALAVVVALMNRAGASRVAPDADGWFRLRPSIGVYILGLLCAAMGVVATLAVPFALIGGAGDRDALVVAVLSALFAAFLWYVVYAFLVVGTRFNGEGMEHRGLLKTIFVPWSGGRRIAYHGFWGPHAVTDGHNRLLVSMYFKGFRQFVEEAARHGIDIAPEIGHASAAGHDEHVWARLVAFDIT